VNYYKEQINKIYTNNIIDNIQFQQAGIKKGLRNINGKGILVGLTSISEVYGRKDENDCEGKIYYRGIDIEDIIGKNIPISYSSFEEVSYLVLYGELPSQNKLIQFEEQCRRINKMLGDHIENIVKRETGKNIMNMMSRSILDMYDFDDKPDDTSMDNLLEQCIRIITLMPVISINLWRRKNYNKEDFRIRNNSNLNTAENILYMLRDNGQYTQLEASILETCLILHSELGGGNNSAFTTRVISSSGSDTYSAIASAICSIKGSKHGGANIKAFQMFRDMEAKIKDWGDENQIKEYLRKVVNKEEFDKTGLIYGIGHAVFTLSDPRAKILKQMAEMLSIIRHREKEFNLYSKVEQIAPQIISEQKNIDKPFCANVDFYSGFIYDMLGIPVELFTPMFVNARIVGWCAHRLEEMCNECRIIHPEFQSISHRKKYISMKERI
jgi:citrate synthase